MNNYFKNSIMLSGLCFSLLSCGGEDLDDLQSEIYSQDLVTADITFEQSDLIGTWNLNQLVADTLVDLNDDNVWNTNLREETTCFDQMSITFKENGTYSSVNARIDFQGGETNDKFVCMDYSATPTTGNYSIDGNIITFHLTVDGVEYKHTKEITYNTDRFSFEVTRLESQQYYNDPGNTAGSKVNVVSSEYIRE